LSLEGDLVWPVPACQESFNPKYIIRYLPGIDCALLAQLIAR
jgi:hypothetical protein